MIKIIALKNYDPSKSARVTEITNILRMRGYRWEKISFDWNEVTITLQDGTTETFRVERSEAV